MTDNTDTYDFATFDKEATNNQITDIRILTNELEPC